MVSTVFLIELVLNSLILIISVVDQLVAQPIALYVANDGSDTNDGSLEHPYKTIAHAQQQLNLLKKQVIEESVNLNTTVSVTSFTIYLRGGIYVLNTPIELTMKDSGISEDIPVIYQAYCDPNIEALSTSVLPYPYINKQQQRPIEEEISPRALWNGVNDPSTWKGPPDPFEELGINIQMNRYEEELLSGPRTSEVVETIPAESSNICIDKVNVGHTCYKNVEDKTAPYGVGLADCISGCQNACLLNDDRKEYSDEFYAKFSHLFGKNLRKNEDCVEICSLSCRGCERVILSGSIFIHADMIAGWEVFVIKQFDTDIDREYSIYRTDISKHLPTPPLSTDPLGWQLTSLFYNDVELPQAGYPSCFPRRAEDNIHTRAQRFDCNYIEGEALSINNSTAIKYSRTSEFAAEVSEIFGQSNSKQLQNIVLVDVFVLNRTDSAGAQYEKAHIIYTLDSIDTSSHTLILGTRSSQSSRQKFEDIHNKSQRVIFRIQNVFSQLDSPGEWFFDRKTSQLYIIPLSDAPNSPNLASASIEIPLLHQLVRISGVRENMYTEAAHATINRAHTKSSLDVAHIQLQHLTFSGSRFLHTNIYEQIPGSDWPMARTAAIFLESVVDIHIKHCTFEKIGGNAIMVSGSSDLVKIENNNISYIGGHGITVLARVVSNINIKGNYVRPSLLYSKQAHIRFNQIYNFGLDMQHSSGIMIAGAQQILLDQNLIFFKPSLSYSVNYFIRNPDGANLLNVSPMVGLNVYFMSLMDGVSRRLETPAHIESLDTALDSELTIKLAMYGFDIPISVKLVGAPTCATGGSRVDSKYNNEYFGRKGTVAMTQCSGCCLLADNSAALRVIPQTDRDVDVGTGENLREALVLPGDIIEITATSPSLFIAHTQIYIGAHYVTQNHIFDILPMPLLTWTIRTRKCKYEEHRYTAMCSGPCINNGGCGNNNLALQYQKVSKILNCEVGYEVDLTSHKCLGPFEAKDTQCDGTPQSILYYNCSVECFATTCK